MKYNTRYNKYLVSVSSEFLSNKQVVYGLFKHVNNLDIALLDACVCQKTDFTPPELVKKDKDVMNSGFGIINGEKRLLDDEIDYLEKFINYLNGHNNMFIIPSVLKEIQYDSGLPVSNRIKRIKRIKNDLRKPLEKRILTFTDEEKLNYDRIYSKLGFLKKDHYLSEPDYELTCSAINSAAYNNRVGLFSNDKNLIRSIVRFDNNLMNNFVDHFSTPINPVKCYTLISQERFSNNHN